MLHQKVPFHVKSLSFNLKPSEKFINHDVIPNISQRNSTRHTEIKI